ncbi:MAG: flagellar biosynthetic protein FliO [Clostridiales bacterium]|nr:flagellar biosynthetic protein FliO [Clostridiales bacterium]
MLINKIQFADTLDLGLKDQSPVFQPSGGVGELIVLIIIFIFVIIACYFVTKFVGNKQMKQLKNSNFTVIDTYRVTPNKFLQLVRIGEKYIVLSVTKDNMTVVTELSKEEVLLPETKQGEEHSFKSVLCDVVHKMNPKNDSLNLDKKKNDGKG